MGVAAGRTHLNVRHAGTSEPVVDAEHRRRAVRALASYARDAEELAELLDELGLHAREGARRTIA